MDYTFILKLIKREPLTDSEITRILEDMCSAHHGCCDYNCLILQEELFDRKTSDCPYFYNGFKMLEDLRRKI